MDWDALAHLELDVRHMPEHLKYDYLVNSFQGFWWGEDSPNYYFLNALNAARVPYFADKIGGYAGKSVLDVGCGGGLFSESVAKQGGRVVAVDPSEKSLEVARAHASVQGLEIDYRLGSIEEMELGEMFDVVCAIDVLEHVNDLTRALEVCSAHLKPGGHFCFLTHNPCLEAFIRMIWEPEYLWKLMPKGFHDFHKFIAPDDLTRMLQDLGVSVLEIHGLQVEIVDGKPHASVVDTVKETYLGYGVKHEG